jgi:hypothetical protein
MEQNQELHTYWYSESFEKHSKAMAAGWLPKQRQTAHTVNGKRYNFCNSTGKTPQEFFTKLNFTDWQLVHEDTSDDIGVCKYNFID